MVLRKDINTLVAYIPGKPLELVCQGARRRFAKLNSNENALGMPKRARQAIIASARQVFRYPDGSGYVMKQSLARMLKTSSSKLILGNGSDELIDIIIKAFINPGENIVTAKTTFVEYEIIGRVNRVPVKTIALKDFRFDLDAIRKAITKKTKLVFIANPNNPTGSYVSHAELVRFLRTIPRRVVTVVDEAYFEYTDARDFPRLQSLIGKYNLVLLRTFSKAYGLAGLRIGYGLTRPRFIAAMERVRQPFNVNTIAQRAAMAALADQRFIRSSRTLIAQEKKKLYSAFTRLRFSYIPTQANFIMFRTPVDGKKLCAQLMKKGVLVRDLKQYKLDTYVRVTIGTPAENKRFLAALQGIV